MNQQLQTILHIVQGNENFTREEKDLLIKAVKKADYELTISEFKLERTEKVKRTTAILLEETIEELELKRKAIEETNEALQQSLENLKATQSQLIQSEKMASLGELTAGIAHEIQNPLNFVNNFSEVSNELIDEMYEEIEKGDMEEAKFIAADIKQNLEKITHHGKRADAIVKGMLQHSRNNNGQREPTDINVLT
ncbi:MAG: histidine kinase dimerization/phospho-acceptor domain-containing protein, partial [Ekhidna sp.]